MEKLIIEYLKTYKSATRHDIELLLMPKLPDILDETQKRNKLRNLLYDMSRRDKTVINNGKSGKHARWIIFE
ncbi:MAG TPA: hypothetical protein PLD62_02345 [Candidatus Cloacimonadota bacterium]|nr:hypothetical protein [Candidatus Cloacimonadota bacterium]